MNHVAPAQALYGAIMSTFLALKMPPYELYNIPYGCIVPYELYNIPYGYIVPYNRIICLVYLDESRSMPKFTSMVTLDGFTLRRGGLLLVISPSMTWSILFLYFSPVLYYLDEPDLYEAHKILCRVTNITLRERN